MSEWWTYDLTDFLLFSPRTYYRLFELYNEAIWPAHIAAAALAIALVLSLRRNDGRATAAILATVWLWTSIAFHLERYATINWAATYFAAAFALQALLLAWTGVVRGRLDLQASRNIPGRIGLVLVAVALIVQPLVGLLFGRPWTQAEIFGIAPDPTAVAILGVLLCAKRVHWHLFAIPALWCVFTGLTLFAMDAPDAWISPLAALLALLATLWKSVRPT
jgi:hypothetical protein